MTTESTDAPQGPTPIIQGTFAIFTTPDGGMVLTYFTEEQGEGKQIIPPFLVKRGLAMAGAGGGPLAKLFGRKG